MKEYNEIQNIIIRKYTSETSITSGIQELKRLIPEEKNPYKSSGKITFLSLIIIITSILIGIAYKYIFESWFLLVSILVEKIMEKYPRAADLGYLFGRLVFSKYTYLILFLIIIIFILFYLSSVIPVFYLGKVCKNRNYIFAFICTFCPSLIVVRHLWYVLTLNVETNTSAEATTGIVTIFLVLLTGIVSCAVCHLAFNEAIFDERTGKYLKIWRTKRIHVRSASIIKKVIENKEYNKLKKILLENKFYTASYKKSNRKAIYIYLTFHKLPNHYMYDYGYIKGKIYLKIPYGSINNKNKTHLELWDFLFIKLSKSEVEELFHIASNTLGFEDKNLIIKPIDYILAGELIKELNFEKQ